MYHYLYNYLYQTNIRDKMNTTTTTTTTITITTTRVPSPGAQYGAMPAIVRMPGELRIDPFSPTTTTTTTTTKTTKTTNEPIFKTGSVSVAGIVDPANTWAASVRAPNVDAFRPNFGGPAVVPFGGPAVAPFGAPDVWTFGGPAVAASRKRERGSAGAEGGRPAYKPLPPLCGNKHEVCISDTYRPSNSCDVCGEHGTAYRCNSGCDYDMCRSCWDKNRTDQLPVCFR
jgi:hypothetical protein